jgi:hypothetical protein
VKGSLKKEVDLYKEKCYALLSPYSIPKGSITKVVAEDALKAKGVPGDIIAQYGLICRLRLDVQKRFDEKEKELADLESKLETHEATFVEVQEKVFDMGPIEKAVETQFLPSINVSRDVYFGGKFVGVMIKRLMKKENREALWTFLRAQYAKHGIQGAEVLIAKVKPLFDAFADLMHLARACRVLKDEEVEQLCKLCASVPRQLRKIVTNRQIKTHMLEFEVPAFVRRWRTLGLFCEDPFESIHGLMKKLKSRYACVRDRCKRDELMYNALSVVLKETAEAIKKIEKQSSRGPYKKKARTQPTPP